MNLDELRERIDELDGEIVRLLNERIQRAVDIGQLKNRSGADVYVPSREKEVLKRVQELNAGPMSSEALAAIYREVMSASLAVEAQLKVAYLGPPATFTHQAARQRFGASVDYVPCGTISDVFTQVEKRAAHYGVVPIENSTEGSVTDTVDSCIESSLKVCAEAYLLIAHHLMARGDREGLQRVYSKPQVFGQCRRWLEQNLPGVELVPVSSTARAAEMAAEEEGSGAVASSLAAELYGLPILNADIQDLAGNTTRFYVLGRHSAEPTGEDKTSLVFAVKDAPGSLFDALEVFKRVGLSMSRIESRPSKHTPWEYLFFVDLLGHMKDEAVARALEDLEHRTTHMTVLGSYPRAPRLAPGA